MTLKELPYNFHDAVLVSCTMHDTQLKLKVLLYEIYYSNKDYIEITFSEIFNTKKIIEISHQINSDSDEPNWLGLRLDNLQYNTKNQSTDYNLYFYLKIDGYDNLKIHCKEITIQND